MDEKLSQLLRYLSDATDEENQMFVAESNELLSAYIDSELAGENAALRYPTVKARLDQDQHFAAEYQELKTLILQIEQDELVEPPIPHTFDLSYLQSLQTVRSWHVTEMGHLLIQMSEKLVRQAIEKLNTPTMPKTATLSLAGQLRHATEMVKLIETEGMDDLSATVMVKVQPDADLCRVTVSVDIPSRGGWPNLADISVLIRQTDQTHHEQLTDPFGNANFEDITIDSLPRLQFEIAP